MFYIINRETDKLELHFTKEEYQALGEESKSKIRSNFLFSRRGGCWVSRAKRPNLYYAEKVAKDLGAEYQGKTGEELTFAEKIERQADCAAVRADHMEEKAAAAEQRGEQLQKPINARRGDIAFFTQPNINTSAGRAFARQREKMFAAYDRGFEAFKKSEYYAQRAELARRTADRAHEKDKGFCDRRVKDAEKNIRAIQKNLTSYRTILERLNSGETVKRYSGEAYEQQEVERWIEDAEERLESEISRQCYYQSCIDDLGGVQFSRENIKAGYTVKLARYGAVEVLGTGPKNITYRTPSGFCLVAAYAEILEIVSAEQKAPEQHPFKLGETFDVSGVRDNRRVKDTWKIVKSTEKSVAIQNTATGECIRRTPKKRPSVSGDVWCLSITSSYDGMIYRPAI